MFPANVQTYKSGGFGTSLRTSPSNGKRIPVFPIDSQSTSNAGRYESPKEIFDPRRNLKADNLHPNRLALKPPNFWKGKRAEFSSPITCKRRGHKKNFSPPHGGSQAQP